MVSLRLMFLALALGASAKPVDSEALEARQDGADKIDGCATVRCAKGTTCKVLLGSPLCVPLDARETKCGTAVCAAGMVCCNASCNLCTRPDMMCTQQVCQSPDTKPPPVVEEPPVKDRICGTKICPVGQECCNSSCGYCRAPGQGCTKEFCAPTRVQCGKVVCTNGNVCCNSSCGICTPPGGFCTQQFCAS
ncbi:hypothetical protein QC763_0000070 [Podospora pseudopauciseta]|uniref:Uncharacterized protein n=2 Tax=Podospora TaxID=5144 RepID=A0ABR0HVX9_9PEZI|nr:hypothetical protein QC763_0000070 [Podospora pseudopauciseta]KAK4680565.1 hypothetical protein QC764_0000070 [Podospora pseudoanserina]